MRRACSERTRFVGRFTRSGVLDGCIYWLSLHDDASGYWGFLYNYTASRLLSRILNEGQSDVKVFYDGIGTLRLESWLEFGIQFRSMMGVVLLSSGQYPFALFSISLVRKRATRKTLCRANLCDIQVLAKFVSDAVTKRFQAFHTSTRLLTAQIDDSETVPSSTSRCSKKRTETWRNLHLHSSGRRANPPPRSCAISERCREMLSCDPQPMAISFGGCIREWAETMPRFQGVG